MEDYPLEMQLCTRYSSSPLVLPKLKAVHVLYIQQAIKLLRIKGEIWGRTRIETLYMWVGQLTAHVISLIFEQPWNMTSVPFFLTCAHNLVQWLLLDKHHSPQEYQSQSSVSTRSIVVHITGKSLKPELISLLAGMYTKAEKKNNEMGPLKLEK